MPRRIAAAVLVAGFSIGMTGAAQDHYSAPVASWSLAQVEQLLSESPWAGRAAIENRWAGRRPNNNKASVTWESAPVVREARSRAGWQIPMAGGTPATESSYVVSVRIWGSEDPLALVERLRDPTRGARLEAEVLSRALLLRQGKAAVRATHMEAHVIDDDGRLRPIPLESWRRSYNADPNLGEPPSPPSFRTVVDRCGNRIADYGSPWGGPLTVSDSHGWRPCNRSALLLFSFPAAEVSPDESIDFVVAAGSWDIRKTFAVREMTINGELHLR